MTLENTIVRDNRAAGVASEADGAGIASSIGPLTLIDSIQGDTLGCPIL